MELSQKQCRLVIESLDEAVYIVDPRGRLTFANTALERLTGYRREELVGYCSTVFYEPSMVPERMDHRRRAHRGKPVPTRWEAQIVRKDGRRVAVEFSAADLMINGQISGRIAIVRDTSHDQSEKTALCESDEQCRWLVAAAQDYAVFMLDPEGHIVNWNVGAERMAGYGAEDIIGQHFSCLYAAEDRQQDLPARQLQTAMADGRVEAEGWRVRKDGSQFWAYVVITALHDESGGLRGFAKVTRDITDRKRAEDQIRQLAYYDPLTKLPNRILFQEYLHQAIEAGQQDHTSIALLLINLDRFREINTTLGYHNGDFLLQQMGRRLQGVVLPDAAMLGRLNVDEFAVLLRSGAEGAARCARILLEALEPPFMIEGLPLNVTASIGITLFPVHGTDAPTLMRRADVAMDAARKSGSGYAIYTVGQDHYTPQRLALLGEVRQALEQEQLCLYFQPKVHLATGRVSGVEALVRWHHPQRGLIPPAEFIPLAEQTGVIRLLTLWVIEAALVQCQAWQEAGLDLVVSVNLSVPNLYDAHFADQIGRLLDRVGVSSGRLILEITESFIMADPVRARETFTHLWAMGVHLSIDDFGTGYSSLGYLKRLPVHEIKIDKTFVLGLMRDRHDAAIVRATVDLGHNLGLTVVAEGVEDLQTWHGLVALGCDEVQGYFISPPQPADDLTRWLRESHWVVDQGYSFGHSAGEDRLWRAGGRTPPCHRA
jgi:diguanylate cyclase (GGDEF)-like protein/PAS domain S-box-containing protein